MGYRAPMNARPVSLVPRLAVGGLLCVGTAVAQSAAPTGQFPPLSPTARAAQAAPSPIRPDAIRPDASQAPRSVAPAPSAQEMAPTPPAQAVANPWQPNTPPPTDTPANAAGAGDANTAIQRIVNQQPDWGCSYESHALTVQHVIVACQEGAVLTLARTASGVRFIARREVQGRVERFYEQDGAVWMRVVQESAERLMSGTLLGTGGTRPSEPTQGAPVRDAVQARPTKPPIVTGTVTTVNGRDVIIGLPEGHGIEAGTRLSLSLISDDPFVSPDQVVAPVVRVADNHVLVHVGMNEVVDVGYHARVTDDRETASRRNPPRVSDVWELRAVLRPMLNLGSVGGGVIGELGIAMRGEHFRFGVELAPLAFAGATGQGNIFSGAGYVFGAVDHQIYSAGLGVGVNTVNDTDFQSEEGSGLTVVQLLRIGAVDGMHLSSRVEAVVFRSEVLFSFLQLQGQLSVADSSWLIVRGGGGSIGYGFGEIVVRNLLWGTGRADSAFVELGLGGAGLFQQACPEGDLIVSDFSCMDERELGGPTFTAGLEWRL